MKLKELLQEQGKRARVKLEPTKEGICHIAVGERVISVEEGDEESLFLYAQIGRLPDSGNEAVYRLLLQTNLYGAETNGAVFALDNSGAQVILFLRIDTTNIDYPTYETCFSSFVDQVNYWMSEWDNLELHKEESPSQKKEQTGEGHPWIKP